MANDISTTNPLSVTADGQTQWVKLFPGWNKVVVKSATWSTSSLAMKQSDNAVDAGGYDAKLNGTTAIVFTGNGDFAVLGPGYIGGIMSTYGGTAVTIKVEATAG